MSGNEADAKEAFSQAASLGFRKFAVRAPDIADLRAGRTPTVRVPASDEDCLPTAQEEISSILGLNPGAGI